MNFIKSCGFIIKIVLLLVQIINRQNVNARFVSEQLQYKGNINILNKKKIIVCYLKNLNFVFVYI